MGPVVGLAARLQEGAEPGQILVGAATERLTRHVFQFTPLSLTVKGISQPVTVHRVERALARPENARGTEARRAALIGREAELARLMEAVEETRQGRGQVVSLIANAGVGKSRLVAELKLAALAGAGSWELGVREETTSRDRSSAPTPNSQLPAPILWLEGRCSEFRMTASYSVFVDLLRELLGSREETPGPTGEALLERSLQELVRGGELPVERYGEIVALLANMLSIPWERGERLQQLPAEQLKHLTFRAVQDLLVALCRRQPVLLVLEDLHWADSLSLELIAFLMESVTSVPLCLLCVYRPEPAASAAAAGTIRYWQLGDHAARCCAGRHGEIRLAELAPEQTRQLAASLLGADTLPGAAEELILQKTRGNPFFVEEIIRSLIAAGMLYREETDDTGAPGPWRAREGIEAAAVPDTIQSVILSRVDRLERPLIQVLQSAAVIGPSFDLRILEHLTPAGIDLRRSLAALEERELVYPARPGPAAEYVFQHALTQQTIYGTILRRERKGLHRNAAEAIERLYAHQLEERCEALAHHFSRSDALAKAVEYLLMAGRKAMRLYANQEAIRYFQQALDGCAQLLSDPRARISAHEGLGDVLFRTGAHREAEAQFQEALEQAPALGDRRYQAALTAKLADAIHWQGRWKQAIQVAEAGLTTLGDDPFNPEAVNLLELIMRSCWVQNDMERARQYADQIQRLLPRVPYFGSLYMVHYGLAWVESCSGNYPAAEAWLQVMEAACDEHRNENGLARCFHGRGDLARAQNDHAAAAFWFGKSLEICERTGDAQMLLEGHSERATALVMIDGDPGEIAAHVVRMVKLAEAMATTGGRQTVAMQSRWMADAYFRKGDYEHAVLAYGRVLEFGTAPTPEMLRCLEQCYLRLNRHAEFFDLCRRVQAEQADRHSTTLRYWHLVPGACDLHASPLLWEDRFEGPAPAAEWEVTLPEPAASDAMVIERGLLQLRATPPTSEASAPRRFPGLLRPVSGEFAAETVLVDTDDPECHTAGLWLWIAEEETLTFGKIHPEGNEVGLKLCRRGRTETIGRGWLPGPELHLRLVRRSGRVTAWCSSDAVQWHSGGEVPISDEGSLRVGLYVACLPPREAAIARFRNFRLCRLAQQ